MEKKHDLTTLRICFSNDNSSSSITPRFFAECANLMQSPFIKVPRMTILVLRLGGRIINIASVSGLYGGPTTAHYAASKAGLISLTQVLARWGADHNIFVNSISPGIIETDLTREELRTGGGKNVVGLTLLKRPGQVEDVASIAVMLASDEQNYMTGQTISPNGGSYFAD